MTRNLTSPAGGVLRRLARRAGRGAGRAGRRGGQGGFVEAGVAVTGLALVLGAAVGSGVASTAVTMSDGATWLPDDSSGQVLQVNPATGEVERRLQVAGSGASLLITQRDGMLVVDDDATGVITTIDLATLLAGGQRGTGATRTTVLVGGGNVFLVDLAGTVRAVDPLTLRDLGAPHRTDALADAVVDDAGTVWLVTTDGEIEELRWSASSARFTVERDRPLRGAGSQSRMVPHADGVTVFSPDGGTVAQVGAGRDLIVAAPGLSGAVLPAETSPSTLAPVAAPSAAEVVMVSGGALLAVDVGALGCHRPSNPAVFASRVYVPCDGTGHVLVLGPDGRRAARDIIVPGGLNPRLVVDDGRLVAYSESATAAVVVEADGSTREIETGPGRTPVQDPSRPPVAAPPVTAPPSSTQPSSTQPSSPQPSLPPSPGTPDAAELPDAGGTVPGEQPTTPPTGGPGADDPTVPSTLPPTAPPTGLPTGPPTGPPTAPPTGAPTGPPTTPQPTGSPTAPPTAPPTAGPQAPLAPGQVRASRTADGTAQVTWRPQGPQADTFVVRASGGAAVPAVEVDGSSTEATVTGLECEARVTFTVEAVLDGATARSGGSSPVVMQACPAAPSPPTAATGVVATAAGDGSVTVSWTAASSGADRYVVSPEGHAGTDVGTATSVRLTDVAPGAGVRFVVQTWLGGAAATSAPSNAVTVAGPPGAPPGVSAEVTGRSGDTLTVAVGFGAAADNGSPVTRYAVQWSGGGASGARDLPAAGGTTLTFSCAGQALCTSGGALQVSVTAHNGAGAGPVATATAAVAPPPPPAPRAGDGVVSWVTFAAPGQYDQEIPMRAGLAPPAGWAAHTGGCELVVTSTAGSGSSRSIPCATSGEVWLGQFPGGSTVTVSVRALGLDVTSAAVPGEVPLRNSWAYCDPNTGICTQPVGLPTDPDAGTATIVPLPWTPVPGLPGGPEPGPFLAAGVVLLGAAGALRAARLRERVQSGLASDRADGCDVAPVVVPPSHPTSPTIEETRP
ncbi:fibronectin type III domain-containing protein [Actinotalea sp. JY-7876]|uniref:fibronectin type III domain-containing protein n=2 Tax=unclassified Actinotalea TaxID=2638618 RepID=UPI0015F408EE|nr:fibronectin type III domain-containing protein [Actinotalea sp. JY-7876]